MAGAEVPKRLKAEGWEVLQVRGSHHRMGRGTLRTTVSMHGRKDLKPGTLASIERQTGVKLK